jgi:hypothetical protein
MSLGIAACFARTSSFAIMTNGLARACCACR